MAVKVLNEAELAEAAVSEPTGGVAGDDVAARRKAAFELYDRQSGGGSPDLDLTKAAAEDDVRREPLDSITVTGLSASGEPLEIEFGPPSGVSMTMRVAIMLGDENFNRTGVAMIRTLMCVRSVNGQKVTPITSKVEAQHLANILGDVLVDQLFMLYAENWSPANGGELQVLRKNKRVT